MRHATLSSIRRRYAVVLILTGFVFFTAITCTPAEDEAPELEEAPGQTEAEAVMLLEADLPSTPTTPVPRPDFAGSAYQVERDRMVDQQIQRRGIEAPEVLEAMRALPRHRFVETAQEPRAYVDGPLPIGHGQTISQPYIVACMTELLELENDDRVLEVGTGSGYQAAVAAMIAREVVTIEIIEDLARQGAQRLENLGFHNITALWGDGYFGYPPRAPYDAIIVTAAARHVPPPLIEQLRPGGRMVIPVGTTGFTQNLLLVQKREDGSVVTRNLLPVRFVPLTREQR